MPGGLSVNVPSQAFAGPGQVTCVPVMIPMSISFHLSQDHFDAKKRFVSAT